jgi:hypothetical protein
VAHRTQLPERSRTRDQSAQALPNGALFRATKPASGTAPDIQRGAPPKRRTRTEQGRDTTAEETGRSDAGAKRPSSAGSEWQLAAQIHLFEPTGIDREDNARTNVEKDD